jgi:subtilisin family serine protease
VLALSAAQFPAAAAVSQGAFRIGADSLWSAGYDGTGQTVAVVDEGFGGLDESIALGELPPRAAMTLVSLDPVHGLDGRNELGGPTQHGTRMAEIVHDVAPGARLVLVNYNTLADFRRATEWVAQRGIPVASHSGSFLDGPFDGTGPAARAVDAAAAAGVLWVNSAGNFAQRHWAGAATPEGTAVAIAPPVGGWLDLHLSWRDPAARASLELQQQAPDGAWATLATGSPSGPSSVAIPPSQAPAGTFRVLMRQLAGPPQQLELMSGSLGLGAAAVPDGSVATPGDAAGALTVGAVAWQQRTWAPFSSRGPTDDGRAKPDLVGPTYVTANLRWPGAGGTSAATAHVAGAAALVRQRRIAAGLPVGAADLRAALTAGTDDLEARGPDLLTGAGMLRLDDTAPAVGLRVVPAVPAVRVRTVDDGTLDRIEVRVGRTRTVVRRATTTVRLRGLRGRALVRVTAVDMAGNRTERRVWVRGRR